MHQLQTPFGSALKRLPACACAAILALVVTACGGGGGPTAPDDMMTALGAQSIFFDGNDDRAMIPIPSPAYFDFGTSGMTFEAWVRPESVSNTGFASILFAEGANGLSLDSTDHSALRMVVSVSGTNSTGSPTGTLQPGIWTHVAGTFNGTLIRLYVNGELVSQLPHAGNATNPSEITIGRRSVSFHGAIDEVRIWLSARTEEEIKANMNKVLSGAEASLVGYYRFEGNTQIVTDQSTGDAHGVLGTDASAEPTDPTRMPN